VGASIAIIANPDAGKDVRRLVAHATTVGDMAKVSIVRRVVLAAADAGVERVFAMPDRKGLVAAAVEDLALPCEVVPLAVRVTGHRRDTTAAAALLAELDPGAVVVLGGDGTNRDVVKGWNDVPLLPISTGTNNVFPHLMEATLAGTAAGLVATGALSRHDLGLQRAKVVRVDDGDVALIDLVALNGAFVGSRALWDVDALRLAVLARAEPASVGISSIGGLLRPCGASDEGGVVIRFADGGAGADAIIVRAPLAPGLFVDAAIAEVRRVGEGEPIVIEGPCVLAFDGERDRVLRAGERVQARVERSGPWLIDVDRVLRLAADRQLFLRTRRDADAG